MSCAIPRTTCQMQSWKRPVDCTTFEATNVSGGSKPNKNLIPEKVYYGRDQGISDVRLSEFSEASIPQVRQYRSCDAPRIVIDRARSRMGERNYHLIFNNCEDFATWCKTGKAASEQVQS